MEFHVSLVGRKSLTREIYRQLRGAILEGRLRPRDPLPPTRELAERLGVARNTVTLAYDRLAGEGFVTSRVGAGTFVSSHIAVAPAPSRTKREEGALRPRTMWDALPLPPAFERTAEFDFRVGLPDSTLFPHKAWRRLTARALRADSVTRVVYGHAAGHLPLRAAIARHIAVSRGVVTAADNITVTNGTQQALDIVARVLVAPRETVAIEEPCYPLPRQLFESHGARVVGVPVDSEGLVVDALPRRARLVYVTPSHQYPLGVAMSLPRRLALLAWAERHGVAIVEDDYDSEFRFHDRPIEPLHLLDTAGRVIYVGTFSKTLLPTLRLGFVVTPASLTTAVQKAKHLADWHTAQLPQMVLAQFLDEGGFARHIRKMRSIYRVRHDMITHALTHELANHLDLIPSTVGLHVAALARKRSVEAMSAVARRAAAAGVEIQELARVSIATPPRAGLVIGYGAIPTSRVAEGLRRLRACLEGQNRPS
jgi:GntR family transcriptional regulator/MocR family aminotransferase